MTDPQELNARKVVLLREISGNILPVSMVTLRRRMRKANIPEVNLGPRKTGIRLSDLDILLAQCTTPAAPK